VQQVLFFGRGFKKGRGADASAPPCPRAVKASRGRIALYPEGRHEDLTTPMSRSATTYRRSKVAPDPRASRAPQELGYSKFA